MFWNRRQQAKKIGKIEKCMLQTPGWFMRAYNGYWDGVNVDDNGAAALKTKCVCAVCLFDEKKRKTTTTHRNCELKRALNGACRWVRLCKIGYNKRSPQTKAHKNGAIHLVRTPIPLRDVSNLREKTTITDVESVILSGEKRAHCS